MLAYSVLFHTPYMLHIDYTGVDSVCQLVRGGVYQLISLKALSLAIGESRKILSQFYAFYGAKLRILVLYRHSAVL